ncbi:MAG: XdhC family protein, partial [Megasphaera sp.]|nr:XdhC family protein [Megasphaera sp.]
LAGIDFSCVVVDDRPEFARTDLFPQAVAVREVNYQKLPEDLGITADDYVCVMTRGHHGDYDVQRQILPIKPHYLGVIGSRRKLAFVKGKLMDDGFSAADIDACYGPIGLAISAETPAEIAISIAAELITVRARREGREKHRPAAK